MPRFQLVRSGEHRALPGAGWDLALYPLERTRASQRGLYMKLWHRFAEKSLDRARRLRGGIARRRAGVATVTDAPRRGDSIAAIRGARAVHGFIREPMSVRCLMFVLYWCHVASLY